MELYSEIEWILYIIICFIRNYIFHLKISNCENPMQTNTKTSMAEPKSNDSQLTWGSTPRFLSLAFIFSFFLQVSILASLSTCAWSWTSPRRPWPCSSRPSGSCQSSLRPDFWPCWWRRLVVSTPSWSGCCSRCCSWCGTGSARRRGWCGPRAF